MLALLVLMAGAVGAASTAPEPATLTILNREVLTMRAEIAGATPAKRVELARARIRELPPAAIDEPISVALAQVGESRGAQFFLGPRLLFSVLEGDVDAEAHQSFDALVKQTRERLEEVRAAWHQLNDRPLLLRGLLISAIGTALFLLLAWTAYRGGLWALKRLQQWRDGLAAKHEHVDLGEFIARVVVGSLQVVQWLLIAALTYVWIRFLLGNFVVTAPVADGLDRWLWDKLAWLVDGFLHGLPGLVTVVIILAITRAIADAVGYLLDAIHQGRLRLPLVHPETTTATWRILGILVWGLGIAVAYPYLPGSGSEAFKGRRCRSARC